MVDSHLDEHAAPGPRPDAEAAAAASTVTGKVDEIMARISGQRLVDTRWLSDQLLDLGNLCTPELAGQAYAVVGELGGRSLVDGTWAVDRLLDIRSSARTN